MKRFAIEKPLMIKRWRREWQAHGRDFGNCHCGEGMGTMRKHKPYESHPASTCRICAWEQLTARKARRRERYQARDMICEWLADDPTSASTA